MVDAHLIESSDLKWSGKFDIILEFKHERRGRERSWSAFINWRIHHFYGSKKQTNRQTRTKVTKLNDYFLLLHQHVCLCALCVCVAMAEWICFYVSKIAEQFSSLIMCHMLNKQILFLILSPFHFVGMWTNFICCSHFISRSNCPRPHTKWV